MTSIHSYASMRYRTFKACMHVRITGLKGMTFGIIDQKKQQATSTRSHCKQNSARYRGMYAIAECDNASSQGIKRFLLEGLRRIVK
jgi:hypothetical protein